MEMAIRGGSNIYIVIVIEDRRVGQDQIDIQHMFGFCTLLLTYITNKDERPFSVVELLFRTDNM